MPDDQDARALLGDFGADLVDEGDKSILNRSASRREQAAVSDAHERALANLRHGHKAGSNLVIEKCLQLRLGSGSDRRRSYYGSCYRRHLQAGGALGRQIGKLLECDIGACTERSVQAEE